MFLPPNFVIKYSAQILIVLLAAALGVASYTIFKQTKDNPVEEIAEEVIKIQTGFEIDLSPEAEDKD